MGHKRLLFFPILLGHVTCDWFSTRWLAYPTRGCNHFPHNVWGSYDNLIQYQSEDSPAHEMVLYVFMFMLTIEPRMVIIFLCAQSSIYQKCKFFFFFNTFVLGPHLTTYYSSTCVQLRPVSNLGTCTLWVYGRAPCPSVSILKKTWVQCKVCRCYLLSLYNCSLSSIDQICVLRFVLH